MTRITDLLRDIDHDISIDERHDAAERIDELEAANEDLDMVAGLRQSRIDQLEAQREAFVSIAAETRAADVARIEQLEAALREIDILDPHSGFCGDIARRALGDNHDGV